MLKVFTSIQKSGEDEKVAFTLLTRQIYSSYTRRGGNVDGVGRCDPLPTVKVIEITTSRTETEPR